MLEDKKEINVPLEERVYIQPKQRQQLFINLIENYKIFYPDINMIYAALNFNSELKIEYLVIFEVTIKNKPFILWDAPFIYTNRAIPAYRYAVVNNLHKEYFDTCVSHLCQMSKDKFYEFLNSSLCGNLSLNENDSKYWKSPNNLYALLKGMSELSLLYIPEGFRNTGKK